MKIALTPRQYWRNCCRCDCDFIVGESTGSNVCHDCLKPRLQRLRWDGVNRTLAPREKQVVALICKGKVNKEIASALHLSEGTVKQYLHYIFQKTEATNRTELAIWGLQNLGEVNAVTQERIIP